MDTSEDWTTAHDLALIYCGLACVDRDLTDDEVAAIEDLLTEWVPLSADRSAAKVVEEAARALKQSQKEVRGAVRRVGRNLDPEQRRETLQHLLRIGEADGIFLEPERELIHSIANVWDLKRLSDDWSGNVSAVAGRRGEDWTGIHELGFLFVQMGQDSDEGLASDTLAVMAKRLREWQPERPNEEGRKILRRALQACADQSEDPLIHDCVKGLREALSPVQQLIVLDDLYTIARAGDPPTPTQRQHIRSLAQAWGIEVRLSEE